MAYMALVLAIGIIILGRMNLWLYLLGVNALTYLLYWLDKRASRQRGKNRTPEYVLLLAGLLGGTLAAIMAQQVIRHKNKKASFQFKFWALTVVQVGLLLFPPQALKMLLNKAFL